MPTLTYSAADGRRCNRCGTPKGSCDWCGKARTISRPTADGRLCGTCAGHRREPRDRCSRCSQIRPVRRRTADGSPLCSAPACAPPPRSRGLAPTCSACGKRTRCPPNASSGQQLCWTCRPRPTEICASCGRQRKVSVRWPLGPVCEGCRVRVLRNATHCARCVRVLPCIGRAPDGRQLCGPCVGVPEIFACKKCGTTGQNYDASICNTCASRNSWCTAASSGW